MNKIVFYAFFITLFLSFNFNIFDGVQDEWFMNHQLDSDNLVVDKLTASSLDIRNYKFLGFFDRSNPWSNFDQAKQALLKYTSISKENMDSGLNFWPYRSQLGLQYYLLKPVWNVTLTTYKDSPKKYLFAFYSIRTVTSLINSFVIALLFLWIIQEFKNRFVLYGLIATSIFFQDWVVVFGKSVYWQIWTLFAPMIINFYLIKYTDSDRKLYYLILASNFVLIYLKSLMGYEYLSSMIIAASLPFIYYRIKYSKPLKQVSAVLIAGCLAFITALITHYIALSTEVTDPTALILELVLKRTHYLSFEFPEFNIPAIRASLNAGVIQVIKQYVAGYQYKLMLIFFIAATVNYFLCRWKYRALLITILAGVSAPLSWYVLAKAHSYIHININFVLWYLPLNYLIYTYILLTTYEIKSKINIRMLRGFFKASD